MKLREYDFLAGFATGIVAESLDNFFLSFLVIVVFAVAWVGIKNIFDK